MGTRSTPSGAVLDAILLPAMVGGLAIARLRTRFLPTRCWGGRLEAGGFEGGAPPELVGTGPRTRLRRGVLRRLRRELPRLAKRMPWKAQCLEQALCASDILRCFGVSSRLRLGVAKDGEDFSAHAWLEVRGIAVLGKTRDRTFQPFADPPGDRS